MKDFALGELGWSLKKWKYSTFTELNCAIEGYWRNWERFYAAPMREICFTMITGNPAIKNKPKSIQEYMKLSIDKEKKVEVPTQEEIEAARKRIFK